MREKMVSSNGDTMTLGSLWGIQVELSSWLRGLGRGQADIEGWEPTSIEQVVETRREDEMAWRGTKKEERTPEKKGNLGPEEGQV